MATLKQKSAIHLCEVMLGVAFTGNIEDKEQVSNYLSMHLQDAKDMYREIACEYEEYMFNKLTE